MMRYWSRPKLSKNSEAFRTTVYILFGLPLIFVLFPLCLLTLGWFSVDKFYKDFAFWVVQGYWPYDLENRE